MFFDLLWRGFVVGLSFTIPGCSGGTFAVYVGVYDRLLHAIGSIFREFRKSLRFLIPFGIGLALGILLFSWLMGLLLRLNSFVTISAFVGLTLGGIPNLSRNVKGKKWGASGILAFVFAFGIVLAMVVFQVIGGAAETDFFSLNFGTLLLLFSLGFIAAITMIIPGVSGSGLLLILGFYTAIVTNVVGNLLDPSSLGYNLGVLIPFALGAATGVIVVSKLLETVLRKWPVPSYLAIIGFIAASAATLFLWMKDPSTGNAFVDQIPLYRDFFGYVGAHPWELVASVFALAAGLAGALLLVKYGAKGSHAA